MHGQLNVKFDISIEA